MKTTKINFEELKPFKVIPAVWLICQTVISKKINFMKVKEGYYADDTDGCCRFISKTSETDRYFYELYTDELEALEVCRSYRLRGVQKIDDRIKELKND